MNMSVPSVTVVTPLFNEEKSLPKLSVRLRSVFDALPNLSWEWVAVDDGSSDRTFEIAQHEVQVAPSWQLLRLTRNFGQQSAYRAGLEAATGSAIIFLDADMQDPPEKIPEMISLWQQGGMHVVGQRSSRSEKGFRGLCMHLFHEVFHRVTGGVMIKNSGTFALMDRKLADALIAMPERGMFLPAQSGWLGFKTRTVRYDRDKREDEPKQSYSKLFAYAWEGITSFSVFPLQLISVVGFLVSAFGFFYAAVLIAIKVLQQFGLFASMQVLGFTTLSVAVLCLGGIQLLSLGIIGSYLAKVFQEVKRRPSYVLSDHITKQSQS
jgi:glycosyltransferase involved in cell wall biosynthesis